MNAVAIFDVPIAQTQPLRDRLKLMGYYDSWLANGVTYYLPNNSLWKPNCELKQAKSEIESLTASLNFQLIRCVVLSVTPWEGIVGSPVPPQGLPLVG